MIQIGSQPIGYLLGGLLADNLFEPAMLNSAWVQHSFGLLVGTGLGAGMSSMFLFTAFFGGLLGFGGLLSKSIDSSMVQTLRATRDSPLQQFTSIAP